MKIAGTNKNRIVLLFLLFGILFYVESISAVENHISLTSTTKLVGGWDNPEGDFKTKYKINYARGVYTPNALGKRNVQGDLFITLNLIDIRRGTNGEIRTKTVEEYISDAREAIRYSADNPNIIAVSQDDFKSWWVKYAKRTPDILSTISANIKRVNPKLMYGATIYETDIDELSGEEWKQISKYINLIYFYLHKRTNEKDYNRYFNFLNTYFPQSKIILGIYHYNRIDYEKRMSLPKEELDLFSKQLDDCLDQLSNNNIIGIEFYPGRLGKKFEDVSKTDQSKLSKELFDNMTLQIEKKLTQWNAKKTLK
jgi:hypothetical protein